MTSIVIGNVYCTVSYQFPAHPAQHKTNKNNNRWIQEYARRLPEANTHWTGHLSCYI